MIRRIFTGKNLISLLILLLVFYVPTGVTGLDSTDVIPSQSLTAIHSSSEMSEKQVTPGEAIKTGSRATTPVIRSGIPYIPGRNIISKRNVTILQSPIPTHANTMADNITNISQNNIPYAPDRVIVKYKTSNSTTVEAISQTAAMVNAEIGTGVIAHETVLGIPGMQTVQLSGERSVEEAVALYEKNPAVEYAQPDYVYHIDDQPELVVPVPLNTGAISSRERIKPGDQQTLSPSITSINTQDPVVDNQNRNMAVSSNNTSGYNVYPQGRAMTGGQPMFVSENMSVTGIASAAYPDDPFYSSLWGLNNYGQTGGTTDADIDAPEAWGVSTGSSSVIVAVVDTGVDYTHPDLAANCIAGYDFVNNDADPKDDHGHGTHCAGTIAAVGNNNIGVIGVAPDTKIMPLKFLDSSGTGYTSDAIEAYAWGYSRGARIFSNSWGGEGTNTALQDAINSYPDAIFICAAGNSGLNTDTNSFSPSAMPNANILAVAATDHTDTLASWSNYGTRTVDVAAPGVNIYSTYPGNSYRRYSGTSMATPHVAGIAALVKATASSSSVAQIKSAIMNAVDEKPGLNGKCVAAGRVNAKNAILGTAVSPPTVTSITPSSAPNTGPVSITGISGTNFQTGATVSLTRFGTAIISGTNVIVTPPSGISCQFPITGLSAGTWNVVVKNPDGQSGTLPNGFSITSATGRISKFGMWRPSTRTWYLDITGDRSWTTGDTSHDYFGIAGDVPVTGDWNGDGISDFGMWRPSICTWFLDLNGDRRWSAGDTYYTYFGNNGDVPVIGDWNGDGISDFGMWRPSTCTWYLDQNGDRTWSGGDTFYDYFGITGDVPVTGDWNGDGISDFGMWRPSISTWFLDINGDRTWSTGDKYYTYFGNNGDIPVTGDWNGDGISDFGMWRPSISTWFLDLNGDRTWSAGDTYYTYFGINGDVPVTGDWSGT
jgi:subtilisin family serine protease